MYGVFDSYGEFDINGESEFIGESEIYPVTELEDRRESDDSGVAVARPVGDTDSHTEYEATCDSDTCALGDRDLRGDDETLDEKLEDIEFLGDLDTLELDDTLHEADILL